MRIRLLGTVMSLAGLLAGGARAAEPVLSPEQRLGKLVFEDTTLSEPAGVACLSCHQPRQAFTGNNGSTIPALPAGARPGTFGARNAPTIMYMAFSPPFAFVRDVGDDGKVAMIAKGGQFWDGRAATLEAQASGPLLNPDEMNNPSAEAVVTKVAKAAYADQFTALYGAGLFDDPKAAFTKITGALAAYERSAVFAPFSSRFDAYLRGEGSLSPQELRGFTLFTDKKKGNCIACHEGNPDSKKPEDWLFTDFTYDNLGVPRHPGLPANARPDHFDLGLCRQPGLAARLPRGVTLASQCGLFKVPTLRNVALTAPYFHNGSFTSLREAVALYATRDTHPERWYPTDAKGRLEKFNDIPARYRWTVNTDEVPYDRTYRQKPRLSEADIDDLLAFLLTLTDAGMGAGP